MNSNSKLKSNTRIANETSLVSVGVPVYNSVDSIRATLDSIVAQDYPSLEVIISDNASTDGTYDILKEYEDKYEYFKVARQDKNRGISFNFVAVLKMAKGKFFLMHAADDSWTTNAISRLVKELEKNSDYGLAMSATKRVRPDGSLVDYIRYQGPYNPNGKKLVEQASLFATPHQKVLDQNIDLFALGMYERELLASIYDLDPTIWEAGVVAIPATVAIASKLIYIDEVLYIRTVQDKPFQDRHPDDPLSPKMASLSYHVLAWKLFRLVMLMPKISWQRKIASLPLFPPLLYMALRNTLGKIKRSLKHLLSGKGL